MDILTKIRAYIFDFLFRDFGLEVNRKLDEFQKKNWKWLTETHTENQQNLNVFMTEFRESSRREFREAPAREQAKLDRHRELIEAIRSLKPKSKELIK